jgi:hypothetical protein
MRAVGYGLQHSGSGADVPMGRWFIGSREFFSVQTYSSVVVENGIALDAWSPTYIAEMFATVVPSNIEATKFSLSMAQNPVSLYHLAP